MPFDTDAKQEPSSVTQLAAAMRALGLYSGANTPAEHAAEARRLGGEDAYRVRLANALLGAAQTEALLADAVPLSPEARTAAYEQQLSTAGAADDPAKRIAFLRWQTLRVSGPLREIPQNVAAGPIPLAAAHTADGVQKPSATRFATRVQLPDRHQVASSGGSVKRRTTMSIMKR